jgi:hypothetical protein
MAKRGEIAATKADADEILAQLSKTTATAKSVELSLSRGDWIQREKNTLKRSKLEQLIVAAYGVAEWISDDIKEALKGEALETVSPINEFSMLSTLYFPELIEKSRNIEMIYRLTLIAAAPTRLQIYKLSREVEAAAQNNEVERHSIAQAQLIALQDGDKHEFTQRAVEMYEAVQYLAQSAHALMEQLTAPVGHTS